MKSPAFLFKTAWKIFYDMTIIERLIIALIGCLVVAVVIGALVGSSGDFYVKWKSISGELVPFDARSGQELKLTITFDGDMLVEPKETKP